MKRFSKHSRCQNYFTIIIIIFIIIIIIIIVIIIIIIILIAVLLMLSYFLTPLLNWAWWLMIQSD